MDSNELGFTRNVESGESRYPMRYLPDGEGGRPGALGLWQALLPAEPIPGPHALGALASGLVPQAGVPQPWGWPRVVIPGPEQPHTRRLRRSSHGQ
jgi:hypothetical protein